MVQGNTFLCNVKCICKTPCGKYLSSILFRILTPHFHWQVRVIVPKVSGIVGYNFLWSISHSIFSEGSVKAAMRCSAAPARQTIHTWLRIPEGENSKFLVLIAGAREITFRQLSFPSSLLQKKYLKNPTVQSVAYFDSCPSGYFNLCSSSAFKLV